MYRGKRMRSREWTCEESAWLRTPWVVLVNESSTPTVGLTTTLGKDSRCTHVSEGSRNRKRRSGRVVYPSTPVARPFAKPPGEKWCEPSEPLFVAPTMGSTCAKTEEAHTEMRRWPCMKRRRKPYKDAGHAGSKPFAQALGAL